MLENCSTSKPDFYDELLKQFGPTEQIKANLLEVRREAEKLQREREAREPLYRRAIEYSASRIFVALKADSSLQPAGCFAACAIAGGDDSFEDLSKQIAFPKSMGNSRYTSAD